MYSTRCTHCRQLINLKTEEIREAVQAAAAAKSKHYEMHCPKCRKPVKIQVKDLKLKLPPETVTEVAVDAPPDQAAPANEETPAQ